MLSSYVSVINHDSPIKRSLTALRSVRDDTFEQSMHSGLRFAPFGMTPFN